MNRDSLKVLMIMVDGFGIPPEGWRNSIFAKSCSKHFIDLFEQHSIPLDACLGVEGIPQSATGQCALFTGVNAPQKMGAHIPAFPGKELRNIIRERNIFSSLKAAGKSVVFANAYVRHGLVELKKLKYRSVTTVMTEAAIGQVQKQDELLKGLAVYHDLTRESLSPELKIPQITPEQAAEHLLNLSSQYDFTLFEYFMTDRAGHKQDPQLSKKVFRQFDRFLCELSQKKPENLLLILCSDHGNCEDLSSKSHNRNSVPLLVLGAPPVPCDDLTSIQDLHDWIIELFNSPKNNKFI